MCVDCLKNNIVVGSRLFNSLTEERAGVLSIRNRMAILKAHLHVHLLCLKRPH